MTIAGMDQNLNADSNVINVANVIPDPGATTPSVWTPVIGGSAPEIEITLPPVNGILAGEYNLTVINITAENFASVMVRLKDAGDQLIFFVSLVKQSRM